MYETYFSVWMPESKILRGALDDRDERLAVRGSERDAVDALVDEVVDDVDLAREVDLGSGAVPADIDPQLLPRLDRAGVNCLPEDVRLSLRDHRNHHAILPPAPIGRKDCEGQQEKHPSPHHDCSVSGNMVKGPSLYHYLVGPDELLFTGLELGAAGSMSRRLQFAALELLGLVSDVPFPAWVSSKPSCGRLRIARSARTTHEGS